MIEALMAAFFMFLGTLFWAVTGHGLFLFYRYLWRAGFGLLGLRKAGAGTPEAAAAEPLPAVSEDPAILIWLKRHMVSLLGLAGAGVAAMAFFWLIEDLGVDTYSKRCLQFGALMVLTTATISWGILLRKRSPDVLGTGMMLLGFLMLPADAAFYETYILGYSTHSAYKLVLFMSLLALLLHRMTGSRAFAWIAPQCLMAGVLLVADKLELEATVTSYMAALLAPLLLGVGEWLTRGDTSSTFLRPIRLSAFLAAGVALAASLSSTPDLFPKLHLIVAILGGGTLATVGFLELDLRALLLLVPYFSMLSLRQYWEYGMGFGIVGPIAGFSGLLLLGFERFRRQGRDRQRGLDPWCSVPAMTLLLFAFIGDCTAGISLLDNLRSLGESIGPMADPQALVMLWTESQRALFYMSRVDGILLATLTSGILCGLGLAYLGAASGIPLLAIIAGIPLAVAGMCGINYLFPFELHGESHWMAYTGLILILFLRSVALERRPADGDPAAVEWYPVRAALASGSRIAGHLLVPMTYLMAGEALFDTRPWWYGVMVIAVVGGQCVVRHVRGPGSVPLRNFGIALVAFSWPLALTNFSQWRGDDIGHFLGLSVSGLVLLGPTLWWMVTREQWLAAGLAAMGLAGILIVMVDKVAVGGMFTKLVVLGFGLGLLWLGSRGRRGGPAATMVWMLLVIAVTSNEVRAQAPITGEALSKLGAASPDDPLLRVRLRAAGLKPGTLPTQDRWTEMKDHVAALSGIDSMAAALQISSGPMRLQLEKDRQTAGGWFRTSAVRHAALDYGELASQLGSGPLPPPSTDRLEWVPASRLYLRFKDPDALGRLLVAYDSAGRSVLRVTAPQLALPGPDQPFRRGLGASLAELAAGGGSGVVSLGDPDLALATDAALLLEMGSEADAKDRATVWAARFGETRARACGRIAIVATEAQLLDVMRACVEASEPGEHSLARAADFRYTKLLELSAPDGFLFVGEAFITYLLSPDVWVLKNRRADCLADLVELEAAVYFGKATGRALPEDPQELRREAELRDWILDGTDCRDGGQIHFEGTLPVCSIHGSRLDPKRVALDRVPDLFAQEDAAYRDFAGRYESLYRQFIDPIAIGIEVQATRSVLETVILPVARLPYYVTLQDWARSFVNTTVPMPRPCGTANALASLAFRALPPGGQGYGYWSYGTDPARKNIQRMMENGGLGQTIGLTLLPGDLDTLMPPAEMAKDSRPLPLLLYQEVGNAPRAKEYFAGLFGHPGGSGTDGAQFFHSRVFGKKSLTAGVDDRAVVIASTRAMAEVALADPGERCRMPGSMAWMKLRPNVLWKALSNRGGFSLDLLSETCLEVMGARQNVIELTSGGTTPVDGVPTGEPFQDPEARCPAGGEYSVGSGGITCSLHGEPRDPRSAPPAAGSALEKMLQSLDAVELELALSPGGIRTRLAIEPATPEPSP